MEKRPEDRYQSVEQISHDLNKLSKGVAIERITLGSERQKTRKRMITIIVFLAAFLVMFLAGLLLQDVLIAGGK